MQKINKAVFRYIEHELYNYDSTKKTIQLFRESIIESTPLKETVPSAGTENGQGCEEDGERTRQ